MKWCDTSQRDRPRRGFSPFVIGKKKNANPDS